MDISMLKNIGWRFAESIGSQAVSFIVSVVLARLLAPEDYGIIAIVLIFINIANIFAESGFGTALIQKKIYDNKDFSTVFYFNILFSISIYIILFLFAPLLAYIYNNNQITIVIRILGIRIIFSSLNSVQKAYVSKTMQFKKFFYSTLVGTITSGIFGVILAFFGFGIWALVFQYLSSVLIDTVVLWFTVKWRPILYFSFERLKHLFSFGSRILFTSLINEIYNQSKSFIIGTVYSTTELAYFNRGQQLPSTVTTSLENAISSVTFSLMSFNQDDFLKVRTILNNTISMLSFFIIQSLTLLIAISPTLIPFLLTDKWMDSIIYLQLASINNILYIMKSPYMESFKAIGKADIYMKIGVYQKLLGISLMLLFFKTGAYMIICVEIFVNFIIWIMTARKAKQEINYSIINQLKTIFPNIISSFVLIVCLYPINFLKLSYTCILIIQILLGIFIIIVIGIIFKNSILINIIKKLNHLS